MKNVNALIFLVAGLILGCANRSQAGEFNLPGLKNQTQVGRITVFHTPKSVTWFLPMAFSSELNCSPQGSSGYRSCFLRIANALSQTEQTEIQRLQEERGPVVFFRDVDSAVVTQVRDRFEGLVPELQNAPQLLMNTLALASGFPYASVNFRGNDAVIASIIEKYNAEGLGTFMSDVNFNGETTEMYLELRDTTALKTLLNRSLNGGLGAEEIRDFVGKSLTKGDVLLGDMSSAEAKTNLFQFIVRNYVRLNRRKKYQATSSIIQEIGPNVVLLDESYSPIAYRCRARLLLKQGGVQKVECGEVEEK